MDQRCRRKHGSYGGCLSAAGTPACQTTEHSAKVRIMMGIKIARVLKLGGLRQSSQIHQMELKNNLSFQTSAIPRLATQLGLAFTKERKNIVGAKMKKAKSYFGGQARLQASTNLDATSRTCLAVVRQLGVRVSRPK